MRGSQFALVALVTVAALLGSTLSVSPTPAATAVHGDVDCDGDADTIDSLLILRSVAQLGEPARCLSDGDVNCSDTAADSIDALLIQRHIASLPVNLPGGCGPIGGASDSVLLNEIVYSPSGGASPAAELISTSSAAGSFDGLALRNQVGQSIAIPPGVFPTSDGTITVLFDGQGSVDGAVVHAAVAGFLASPSGWIELRRGAELLDRAVWGTDQPDAVNVGGGGLVGEIEPGFSIGRPPGSTAIDNEAWATYRASQVSLGALNPLPSPAASLPLDGAMLETGLVQLAWYPTGGAATYEVQVATDAAFGNIIASQVGNDPGLVVGSLVDGDYFWRVRVVASDGDIPVFGPAQSFTVAANSRLAAADATLNIPMIYQHKDTGMLHLEHPVQTGQHAWDRDHGEFHPGDAADNTNCVLAAIAMLVKHQGGSVSQDRLGYELLSRFLPGPEFDLNHGRGVTTFEVGILMEFAFSGEPIILETNNTDDAWSHVTAAIDSNVPLVAGTNAHAFLITGYFEQGGARFVRVNDPMVGQHALPIDGTGISQFWGPGENAQPFTEEATIRQDSDADGVVDFDETRRFNTSPEIPDTDRDGITDKADVAASVFHGSFGWAYDQVFSGRDWDDDGLRSEVDCDSDNDGQPDGTDSDDYSDPPSTGSPVPCEVGGSVVTLYWNADSDMDIWVIPNQAASIDEAIDQYQLPGYDFDAEADCLLPEEQTQRTAVVDDATSDANYVGVWLFHTCRLNDEDPNNDGPATTEYTLTIQFSDGRVEQFTGALTHKVDDWKLHGPLDFP